MFITQKYSIKLLVSLILGVFILSFCAYAQGFEEGTVQNFEVAKIFNDNMVFQQNEPIRIWGTSDDEGGIINARMGGSLGWAKVTDGKWEISFAPRVYSSEPLTIEIFGGAGSGYVTFENIRIGDVWWVIGQSNIEFASSTSGYWETYKTELTGNENVVLLDLAEKHFDNDYNTRWRNLNSFSAADASAVACFTLKSVNDRLNNEIPLVAVITGYAGEELASFMPPELTEDIVAVGDRSKIYDAVIEHIVRMPVKGIIWYQGEADASEYSVYAEKLKTYINWLRDQKQQDNHNFPVYAIELSPSFDDPSDPNRQYMDYGNVKGELGFLCAELENFYVCPTSDTWTDRSFSNNLHPDNKHLISDRLSYMLLSREYGFGNEEHFFGPMLKTYTLSEDGKNAVLTFDKEIIGDKFDGLTLVGENWHPVEIADIRINGNKIEINADSKICIVRYNNETSGVFGETVHLANVNRIPAPAFTVWFSNPSPESNSGAQITTRRLTALVGGVVFAGVIAALVIIMLYRKKKSKKDNK